MMDNSDTEISALVEVFELYMLRDAKLTDMREPIAVATRSMLDAGMTSGMVLGVIDGAICVASAAAAGARPQEPARELRAVAGPWVMQAYFDPARRGNETALTA